MALCSIISECMSHNVLVSLLTAAIAFLHVQGVSLQVQGQPAHTGSEAVGLAASTSLVTLVIGIKALYEIRGIPMVRGVFSALRRYCTKVLAKKVSVERGQGFEVAQCYIFVMK